MIDSIISHSKDIRIHRMKKRSKLVFILLIFLGGVGYLYLGRPVRFILFAALIFVLNLAAEHGLNGFVATPAGLLVFGLISAAMFLGAIVDGMFLIASEPSLELKPYNQWWWYLSAIILVALIIAGTPLFVGRSMDSNRAVRTFHIPSASMMPTLQVGDYLVGDTRVYETSPPQRGDIVVYRRAATDDGFYVGRILGLPGETIRFERQVPFVNGNPLFREETERYRGFGTEAPQYLETTPEGRKYKVIELSPDGVSDNTGDTDIEPDHYFIVGDNRDNSLDSRNQLGLVSKENIVARMNGIYWASEWSRIGKSVLPN